MMQIGVRVFEDNVEEMAKLDADYLEAAVRPEYAANNGSIIPETNHESYESIEDHIKIIHGGF